MPKFSGTNSRPLRINLHSSITTTNVRMPTYEGGDGWTRTLESDLFLLAATNMVSEDTFYESAKDRDARFVSLIHQVTQTNPTFIAGSDPEGGKFGLCQYLRSELLMRSAPVVMACEYIKAGGPNGRSVVDRACQRPDEPAEMLGYWLTTHGRRLPMPLKRGVADAARRLYSERSALRYDGQSRGLRMADVLELTHPKPRDDQQSALFRFLIDRRHNRDETPATWDEDGPGASLGVLFEDWKLRTTAEKDRRSVLAQSDRLARAGWSWERLAGWLPGGMDAEAWEAVIPSMGATALCRNLRNFDQARLSEASVDAVISKITDPAEVAKARLFPYQVWSAYKNAPSDNWKRALGKTLALTTQNVPSLNGTLIVIDTSSSMQATISGRSTVSRVEIAAVMAMATLGCSDADVVIFGQESARIDGLRDLSSLNQAQFIVSQIGRVGHATYGHSAIATHFDPSRHKRVVLFTDDQMHDSGVVSIDHVPLLYTVNLAGYHASSTQAGEKGRYTLGGFSDATFAMMKALEAGRDANWPF